jgi:hypothetical protein
VGSSFEVSSGWAFLGPRQVCTRSSRTLLSNKKKKKKRAGGAGAGEKEQLTNGRSNKRTAGQCASKNDSGDAETNSGMDDEVLSAVDKLMQGEKGEKLNKALEEVVTLKAAKEALEKESPVDEVERKRVQKLREESLEQLQEKLAEVEKAKKALDSVDAQREDLKVLLVESKERIESLKVAAAGAAAGALFALPLTIADTNADLLFFGSAVVSSALFALTYRYAVTNDVENTQLKSGVVLAFALTRGLSELNGGHEAASSLFDLLRIAFSGENITRTFQSLLLFGFASVAVEFGIKQKVLKLYGQDKDES